MPDLSRNQLFSLFGFNHPPAVVLPDPDGALDSVEEYEQVAYLYALEPAPAPAPAAEEVAAARPGLGIWRFPVGRKRAILSFRTGIASPALRLILITREERAGLRFHADLAPWRLALAVSVVLPEASRLAARMAVSPPTVRLRLGAENEEEEMVVALVVQHMLSERG